MKSIKINLQQLLGVFLFFSATLLFSCQKDNSAATEPVADEEAVTISEENAAADAEYEESAEIGFSADADLEAAGRAGYVTFGLGIHANIDLFAELSGRLGPCATITVTPNDSTYPKTVVIDYGDGCICRDGKFRKGAIILHYTKPIRRPGAVLTITFRNYFVNRAHIEGTKIIKNQTEGNVHQYSVVVINGKVTWPTGRGFKYEKVKTVTQVRGMETLTVRDDVYSIEGRSKTTYANGVTVNKNTETPLIKPVACSWIVKGILKIRINNRELFLDFGSAGECDNKALLTWNGHVKEITLP
ncbi:MAG TPA: hypothetical protein VGD17_08500 [Chitinophagaceae bacterium]